MIITQTPLRISLFGGGTDFPDYFMEHGGAVLSTAIDKYIFVTIKKRFDDKIRIGYSKTELVDSIDEIEHDLIRESLRISNITQGVEMATMADIPTRGSGLGSSSAVTVGALHAIFSYLNNLQNPNFYANYACYIERDILNAPIGLQDQYITACGGLKFITFQNDYIVKINHLNIEPNIQNQLNKNLMLFYTGISRQANTVLHEQKENIKGNLSILHDMKKIAYDAKTQLENNNIDMIGNLLHESWQLKKQLSSGISNYFFDDIYQSALDAGALGGKISGAGGGGFLLLYCLPEKQKSVKIALRELQELPFNIGADGTKVIFNYQR